MDITGKAFISKGNYGFYTTIKDKQNDTKVYLPVSFKKGQEPDDGGQFNIERAFLAVFAGKTGEAKLKLVVMDYSDAAGANISPSGVPYPKGVTFEETDSEEPLPF